MDSILAWLKKFWGWIAAGAAIVGGVMLALLSVGGKKQPVPPPPVDPKTDAVVRDTEVKAEGERQAAHAVADAKVDALKQVAETPDDAERRKRLAEMANKS